MMMEHPKSPRGLGKIGKIVAFDAVAKRGTIKGQTSRRLNQKVWVEQNGRFRRTTFWRVVDRVWFEPKQGVQLLERPPAGYRDSSLKRPPEREVD
jgi:hypothetical protein